VRAEPARGGDGSDAEVTSHIIARLRQELGKLIGPAGFDILIARSLVLARRAHPVLAGVTAVPGGTPAGLDDPALDEVALIALVANFIELLATLIGEDLAMGLVIDVWPAAAEEEKK
jgi:hypothetical protein